MSNYRLRRRVKRLRLAAGDLLRATGITGHARWCCMSAHSYCARNGGCSGSCNCNARRAKWRTADSPAS